MRDLYHGVTFIGSFGLGQVPSLTNWQLQSAYVISGGDMLHESPEICVQLMDNHERFQLVVLMPN